MKKIKVERDYVFDNGNTPVTWKEFKSKCKAKDGWLVKSPVRFMYEREETDKEYKERMRIESVRKKFQEKQEYELYLKLKEKYENN